MVWVDIIFLFINSCLMCLEITSFYCCCCCTFLNNWREWTIPYSDIKETNLVQKFITAQTTFHKLTFDHRFRSRISCPREAHVSKGLCVYILEPCSLKVVYKKLCTFRVVKVKSSFQWNKIFDQMLLWIMF